MQPAIVSSGRCRCMLLNKGVAKPIWKRVWLLCLEHGSQTDSDSSCLQHGNTIILQTVSSRWGCQVQPHGRGASSWIRTHQKLVKSSQVKQQSSSQSYRQVAFDFSKASNVVCVLVYLHPFSKADSLNKSIGLKFIGTWASTSRILKVNQKGLQSQNVKTVTHQFTTELFGATGKTGKNYLHVAQVWHEC